jgi:putative nucleotidyltransferase with HDIG domain
MYPARGRKTGVTKGIGRSADTRKVEARSPSRAVSTAFNAAGLVAALIVGALTTTSEDWHPLWLAGTLLGFALGSHVLALPTRNIRVTGSFSAIVLAMAVLGPAPAMTIGLVCVLVDQVSKRHEVRYFLSNLFTYAAFPLIGGLVLRALEPQIPGQGGFVAVVLLVFVLSNFLNFVFIYGYVVYADGRSWRKGLKEVYLPVLPVEVATGVLTASVVWINDSVGGGAILLVTIVVLIFQYMLRTALQAFERGEELEERNRELAGLQFGLIRTVLKTLSLRDHMTARHSAAVARYSLAVAEELGLDSETCETIHTAALFHDVGKFIFPDSILLADTRLSDEDYEIVKRHPEVGAELIGEIEGYEKVSEIVRYHHERIDGRGYPTGLSGEDIPLGSRIIAVADTYDVLTARDTYRKPVSVQDAFAELRRSAGTQLDNHLVETFIEMIVNRGVAFRHSTEADFEAELAFEQRVADYAAPRRAA